MNQPTFKLIVTAVLSLNLISSGTAISFADPPTLSESQERVLGSPHPMTYGGYHRHWLASRRRDEDDDFNEDKPDDED